MTDKEKKLVLGGLLHDIGKVIPCQGQERTAHSQRGYVFLKKEAQFADSDVLDCVRYHHRDALQSAPIGNDSLAYIIHMADNIASAADGRDQDLGDTEAALDTPLQSVFDILNRKGNTEQGREPLYYAPGTLEAGAGINFPTTEKISFDPSFYEKIKDSLSAILSRAEWREGDMNALLETLEAKLSYVPASAAEGERADVSLFDHLRLTAGVACCIFQYLEEKGEADYRQRLFEQSRAFYGEEAFLLYSMDISGIQDFIYTIASKNALKTLRARSFYLEIMTEHITDCLLERLHLSRANLIYSGGGHCYILMANTLQARETVDIYMEETNRWLREQFQIALYVAWGYAPCSAAGLQNQPRGSYGQIFWQLGEELSRRKAHRYSAEDIRQLNGQEHQDYTRECTVCKRIAAVSQGEVCPVCQAIERFSGNILYDDVFIVTKEAREAALPLPGGYYLVSGSREMLEGKTGQEAGFVRSYRKNRMATDGEISTKLWVGDYTTGKTFQEYADEAEGIGRIGILRADVDNLGQAFVSGFENAADQDRYVALSRTATLSRQLSLFFKLHINQILEEGEYSINGEKPRPRNATICYSGGDDLFIVGSWNDIIELAVDIRRNFARYTKGALTLSAGIGVYQPGYPISAAAREVAAMEEESKSLPGKNAVTLLEDGRCHIVAEEQERGEPVSDGACGWGTALIDHEEPYSCGKSISDGTYSWKELEDAVLGEKYQAIYRFFERTQERGMHFLYNLLELIRSQGEKINFARYVYLLSRLEPEDRAEPQQREAYREFSGQMYRWVKEPEDCRQMKTAIQLYAYLKREKEERRDAGE